MDSQLSAKEDPRICVGSTLNSEKAGSWIPLQEPQTSQAPHTPDLFRQLFSSQSGFNPSRGVSSTSHSSDLHRSSQSPKLLLPGVRGGSVWDLLEKTILWIQDGSRAALPASLTSSSQCLGLIIYVQNARTN